MLINWQLTPDEAAYVLQALSLRPYREVNSLIGKLNKAAADQVAKAESGNVNPT